MKNLEIGMHLVDTRGDVYVIENVDNPPHDATLRLLRDRGSGTRIPCGRNGGTKSALIPDLAYMSGAKEKRFIFIPHNPRVWWVGYNEGAKKIACSVSRAQLCENMGHHIFWADTTQIFAIDLENPPQPQGRGCIVFRSTKNEVYGTEGSKAGMQCIRACLTRDEAEREFRMFAQSEHTITAMDRGRGAIVREPTYIEV